MMQTELFYPSYAHRADALELFTSAVAPALGWARAPQAAPPWLSTLGLGDLKTSERLDRNCLHCHLLVLGLFPG